METFYDNYKHELLASVLFIGGLVLLYYVISKGVRKVGTIGEIAEARTRLILKYISITNTVVGILGLPFIWGVNFQELGLFVSSALAVIGVALFANWSILSNLTAGIILFFSFPFKIGDRIRILDKDFPEETTIVDIKAFHMHLISKEGELVTCPNNILLQKGAALIERQVRIENLNDPMQ